MFFFHYSECRSFGSNFLCSDRRVCPPEVWKEGDAAGLRGRHVGRLHSSGNVEDSRDPRSHDCRQGHDGHHRRVLHAVGDHLCELDPHEGHLCEVLTERPGFKARYMFYFLSNTFKKLA